ncbi:MAG TPA: 30S ribosomal protein S12 methylthiotransferase RimO [Bacteroidetes bacterium]|nr:30S ribosomal protein S12 methylthiotransferase RimO [Bacteroidota bacterium]
MPVPQNKKVSVITLGCSKNTVDSEVLLRQLKESGLQTDHNPQNFDGGTVIINTCGFIRDAQEESIDMILTFAEARKKGIIDQLIVMGCLSQRYQEELKTNIPEVDHFFGVHDLKKIVETVGGRFHPGLLTHRSLTTPPHYAYLKVSEGCDRTCAFCSIPAIRGPHISKPVEDILTEANLLVSKGVREIMLIAQDLTRYGRDLYGKQKLPEVLEKLSEIPGLDWIRLHYAYPSSLLLKIIPLMKNKKNICHYLDIPFQHISDPVLKKMRRGYTEKQIREIIEYLRKEIPDLALRTTLLVGHPGETEKDFQKLLDFVREIRFDRLGIFPYSHEEGTYAGRHYTDDIPKEEKMRRVEEIMNMQEEIAFRMNKEKEGKTFKVLIDYREENYWVGRTQYDSPEVDQEVLISFRENAKIKPGQFHSVKITRVENFDLVGVLNK